MDRSRPFTTATCAARENESPAPRLPRALLAPDVPPTRRGQRTRTEREMETRMHASPARNRSVAQRSPQDGTFRPAAAGRTARSTACSSVLVLVLSLSLLLLAACRRPWSGRCEIGRAHV